jgi:hypothetical protein
MPWPVDFVAPANSAAQISAVAAVSREPATMDVVWVNFDGSVNWSSWAAGTWLWSGSVAPAGSASVYSGIALVSPAPTMMLLWYAAPDGAMRQASWSEHTFWQPSKQDGNFNQLKFNNGGSGGMAALVRTTPPSWVELLFTDNYGALWHYSHNVSSASNPPGAATSSGPITGPGYASGSGVSIAALSQLLLYSWCVSESGAVYIITGTPATSGALKWGQPRMLAPAGSASTLGGLASVARSAASAAMWYIGAGGSIQQYSTGDAGQTWTPDQVLEVAGLDTGLAAVSLTTATIDLFSVGQDGSVEDRTWSDGAGWNPVGAQPVDPGTASLSSQLAVVSPIPAGPAVTLVGQDGSVQVATGWDMTPAPPTGLQGFSNYIFYSDCNNLRDVSVAVTVTDDIMPSNASGLSIQLNCYSPNGSRLGAQQYALVLMANATELVYIIQNEFQGPPWGNVPPSPIQNNVAGIGSTVLAAGTTLTIALENDPDGVITGARFSVMYPAAPGVIEFPNSTFASLTGLGIAAEDQAPIVAFQLDICGPDNRAFTDFTSGAGTITYSASDQTPLTVLNSIPDCTGYWSTEENSTMAYGLLPSGWSSTVFNQPFHS